MEGSIGGIISPDPSEMVAEGVNTGLAALGEDK